MDSEDFDTPRKRKRNLNIVKETVKEKSSKIKQLYSTVRNLRRRIKTLSSLLKYLKGKAYISEASEISIEVSSYRMIFLCVKQCYI